MDKQIVLRPNEPPQFIGAWTVGEVLQMAQGLAQWTNHLPLSSAEQETEQDSVGAS